LNRRSWRERLIDLQARVTQFMFGAAMSWVMVPHQLNRRAELERLFMLMTVSELMGVPLSPPPGGLRLLPFLVPQILYWRRRYALWDEA
jgi:hypothetical protein